MTRSLAVLILALFATGCMQTLGRPTLRPGSDMALPSAPPVQVEKKNGETCVSVRGVIVNGGAIQCSPIAPDSTQRPPRVKPPQR